MPISLRFKPSTAYNRKYFLSICFCVEVKGMCGAAALQVRVEMGSQKMFRVNADLEVNGGMKIRFGS